MRKKAGTLLGCAAFLIALGAGPVLAGAKLERARVWAAVNAVRLDLGQRLDMRVPSLNVLVRTPGRTVFVSTTDTPTDAVSPDTFFRFASNTKNFTAAAVLLMHQKGWLSIKDFITDPIPGSGQAYVPSSPEWDIPHKGRITIEQLLNHSAGVFDVDNDAVPGCGGESYTKCRLDLNPDHRFTAAELADVNARHGLSYFEPGAGYHYSNTGYSILGEIVARVYSIHAGTAKTHADYLHEHMVGGASPVPLPIRFPWKVADRTMPEPRACGAVRDAEGMKKHCRANMGAHVAEGNGYGTMAALNRYIRTLMRGENVLKPATVEMMRASASGANPLYGSGCEFRAGLGYGHNGAIQGNLSLMAYNPETSVSVVAFMPVWDQSRGLESFKECFAAIYKAAYAALKVLGHAEAPG